MGVEAHKEKWRRYQTAQQQARPLSPVMPALIDNPLMQASLDNDIQRLHEVNSFARKQAIKRTELLPRYRDYLATHMAGNKPPNAVLVRNMIWAFDVEDLEYAMALATYALNQGGATMPEGFKRDFPNYVLGTVGDLSVAQARDKKTITPYIETVYNWLNEHPQWDIVDKIKAAVLKGLGCYVEDHDPIQALALFEQAQTLDSGTNLRRKIASLKGEHSP